VTTPYRNEIDALRERKASLEAEIARLRDQTTRLDELRAREAELAGELAGIDGRLNAGFPKRGLPLLDQVRVASPCKADWNEMLGDERVRFCLSCEKNVYNLSSMTKDDAESLLRERLGNDLCLRFYQRTDGTILTADCPVGVKKKRRKKLALAVAGAGALAAAAATSLMSTRTCRRGALQGEMDMTAVAGGMMYEGEGNEVKGERMMVPPVAPIPTTMGSAAPTFTTVMGAPPPLPATVHPEPKNHPPLKTMGKPSIMGRR
jgi:hypothetical protein